MTPELKPGSFNLILPGSLRLVVRMLTSYHVHKRTYLVFGLFYAVNCNLFRTPVNYETLSKLFPYSSPSLIPDHSEYCFVLYGYLPIVSATIKDMDGIIRKADASIISISLAVSR